MPASTRSGPPMPAQPVQTSCVPSLSTGFVPIPRGEKRRREIAAVAELVFFESGFADTTMQMIAARAGASKETLYRHFGSKEELFSEIVECRAKVFLESIDEKFERPGSVADVLRDLGTRMLETMMGAQGLSLCRLVIGESPRSPELGRIFFHEGPDRVERRLTEFLALADKRGELACEDPHLAAVLFLGAVVHVSHLKGLVFQEQPMTAWQVKAHIDGAVGMFLARYAKG